MKKIKFKNALIENIELCIQSGNQGIYGHLYFFKHHPDINKRQK